MFHHFEEIGSFQGHKSKIQNSLGGSGCLRNIVEYSGVWIHLNMLLGFSSFIVVDCQVYSL